MMAILPLSPSFCLLSTGLSVLFTSINDGYSYFRTRVGAQLAHPPLQSVVFEHCEQAAVPAQAFQHVPFDAIDIIHRWKQPPMLAADFAGLHPLNVSKINQ